MRGLWALARSGRVALMLLRESRPFPVEQVHEAAHQVLHLLNQDRDRLLYNLGSLDGERQVLRLGVKVGVMLADNALAEPQWRNQAVDVLVGGLLHDLGKPLLVERDSYSRDSAFSKEERQLLRQHAPRLIAAVQQTGWNPPATVLDIVLNINERLNGTGYPAGKAAPQLSELARMAAVLRTGCKLMDSAAGSCYQTPAEIYRLLYLRPHVYDRGWVTQLTRRYSFYPVGSLVRFSSGALGWVLKVSSQGLPAQVRLAREPGALDKQVNRIMDVEEAGDLGKPEDVVNPVDYNVTFSQE